MEFVNEIMLDGVMYCFEEFDQVAKAHAWIDAHRQDTRQFRSAFPDARPVSTNPYGAIRKLGG
ncbi:hypothetical protein [Massilia sp. GCM10023247]|uniref:hypothetical protein n=1 Tax=Massilia sp. GCM10023247 TaxID=3252643 RepID=UPI0036125E0C